MRAGSISCALAPRDEPIAHQILEVKSHGGAQGRGSWLLCIGCERAVVVTRSVPHHRRDRGPRLAGLDGLAAPYTGRPTSGIFQGGGYARGPKENRPKRPGRAPQLRVGARFAVRDALPSFEGTGCRSEQVSAAAGIYLSEGARRLPCLAAGGACRLPLESLLSDSQRVRLQPDSELVVALVARNRLRDSFRRS